LIAIRKKQLKIFEDLAMFEQRIICHELPNSFNSTTINNNNEEQCANKCNKIVQDYKRQMLNVELEQYELKIQHYEHLYEQELATFQSEICKTNSFYQMSELNMLMHSVTIYVYHHIKLWIREVRYKESAFRVKLLRHHRRRQSLIPSKTIDVYPQIIVDVPKVPLNQTELDYLSQKGQLEIL
jgi:hypothetical protein